MRSWSTGAVVALAALLFGAGAFVGAWAGSALSPRPSGAALAPTPPSERVDGNGARELAAAAAELRAVLTGLEHAIGGLAASTRRESGGARSADVASGGLQQPELAAALRELAQAVEALRNGSHGAAPAREPTEAERLRAFELDELRAAWSRGPEEVDSAVEDFSKRHLAWTWQQALQAFGRPDHIASTRGGGMTWWYELPLSESGRHVLYLYFQNDLLTTVQHYRR